MGSIAVSVEDAGSKLRCRVRDRVFELVASSGDNHVGIQIDGPDGSTEDQNFWISRSGPFSKVRSRGEVFHFGPVAARMDPTALEAGDTINAPLPGKIVALVTKPGAAVKKGDPLITLEAMKMEHALKAPRDGVVAEVTVVEGAQVKEGDVLVRLAAVEAA